MFVSVTVSLFFSIILLSPFVTYAVIPDPQRGHTPDLFDSVLKKMGKLMDALTSCNNIAMSTGMFPDYCTRFQLMTNAQLAEIFNDNQTKIDIDTILYG
ncbi:MAG: hypothetical protein CV087_10655 [Candidatus Brocadia sp. WS118]|nr:MAG: hypothetical protein CV087_10655 [Candidatus Brocadia sp. WS118]